MEEITLFDLIYKITGVPFGYVLGWFYDLFHDYGIAILVVTIIVKLITIPFNIKSQKSMAKFTALKPKEEAIRRKIKDPQKQQEAIAQMYQEEGASPMSGCLPNIVPFILLIGYYGVMRQPLTYMWHVAKDKILEIGTVLKDAGIAALEKFDPAVNSSLMNYELQIAQEMTQHADKLTGIDLGSTSMSISSLIDKIDFNFLGMEFFNLAAVPNIKEFNFIWFLPFIAAITTLLSTLFTMKTSPSSADSQQNNCMMRGMMFGMPILTLWIGFTMPSAMSYYWILSNILGAIQSYIMPKLIRDKKSGVDQELVEQRRTQRNAIRQAGLKHTFAENQAALPAKKKNKK